MSFVYGILAALNIEVIFHKIKKATSFNRNKNL